MFWLKWYSLFLWTKIIFWARSHTLCSHKWYKHRDTECYSRVVWERRNKRQRGDCELISPISIIYLSLILSLCLNDATSYLPPTLTVLCNRKKHTITQEIHIPVVSFFLTAVYQCHFHVMMVCYSLLVSIGAYNGALHTKWVVSGIKAILQSLSQVCGQPAWVMFF